MKTKLSILALVLLTIIACNKASDNPDASANTPGGGGTGSTATASVSCLIDGVPFTATKTYMKRFGGAPASIARFELHAEEEATGRKITVCWYNHQGTVYNIFSDYDTVSNQCLYGAALTQLNTGINYALLRNAGNYINSAKYTIQYNGYPGEVWNGGSNNSLGWVYGTAYGNIPSTPPTIGNLYFKMNQTTKKIDGTFSFTGKFYPASDTASYPGLDSVVVTNGVITGLNSPGKFFCPNWGY